MAYFNQEMKKAIAPKIKELAVKYGVKATLGVRHHSEVVLNISEGKIDFIENYNATVKAAAERRDGLANLKKDYIQVNQYHIDSHFSDIAMECLEAFNEVLNTGNYDHSDIQTDYFDKGFYVSINVGTWEKPYKLIKD